MLNRGGLLLALSKGLHQVLWNHTIIHRDDDAMTNIVQTDAYIKIFMTENKGKKIRWDDRERTKPSQCCIWDGSVYKMIRC